MKTAHTIFIFFFAFTSFLQSQENYTVQVNLDVKHSVSGVSEFDRSKFIILHADIGDNEWDSDAQRKQFLEDYDVYLGRNNGGMVWEFNQSAEDPARNGWPDINVLKERGETIRKSYGRRTSSHEFENRYGNMIYGGQPIPLYPNGRLTNPNDCCSEADPWAYKDYDAIAEFYANYFKEFFGSGAASSGR